MSGLARLRVAPEPEQDDWKRRLIGRVLSYVSTADIGEESRRRQDRLGAKLFYGQHWAREMPSDRAAITANIGMALLQHKVAIMTKQDPIPVIEPDDVGDAESADLMRSIIQRVWSADGMREKSRRALTLAGATRTCMLKVLWDSSLRGGAGDVHTEVIPGWRALIDNRVSDPGSMTFCGHRATMSRSRTMLLYPEAAEIIAEAPTTGTRGSGPSGSRFGGAPISTPWRSTSLPPPGQSIVNGKPVVTAFAGELAPTNKGVTDDVDVIEMYHRDYTMERKMVKERDDLGRVKQEHVLGEDGKPSIDETQSETMHIEGVGPVDVPMPSFVMRDVTVEELVRVYPHWRRTTVLYPDEILLEDVAWDGPLPFAFVSDVEPLDGILARGSLLQTQQLQSLLNVGLSTVTDNLRFGSLNAWLAGQQSGITSQQIIPGAGQVIPVQDITQIKALESPPLDGNFFGLLDRVVTLMEKIIGASGVMQGESAGRADSAGTYDTLAEIGGARIVEATQRFETALAKWAEIVGWFVQKFYTQRHAISIEDDSGNLTWERAWGPMLQGTLSYRVLTGSTMAWSDSAKQARDFQELQAGIIDKIEYWKRRKTPHWQQIAKRISEAGTAGPAGLLGPAASPPPRTRATANRQRKPPAPKMPGVR